MIKPETSDFFGNELDKAKLEIVSYWKDKYEKTQKALDVAKDALKNISDRYDEEIARSADEDDCADWFICSQDVMLLVEQALEQITAEQKDK